MGGRRLLGERRLLEPQFDELGNYVGETWVDTSYWQESSYYDESANWEPVIDIVRTYKKCKSFNRGRGRVAINFDNYSRTWWARPRLAYKNPSDPSFMDVAASFRAGSRLAGKDVPTPVSKADAPRPTRPAAPRS